MHIESEALDLQTLVKRFVSIFFHVPIIKGLLPALIGSVDPKLLEGEPEEVLSWAYTVLKT